jgi:GNAT superfamily N-acetyltransferase
MNPFTSPTVTIRPTLPADRQDIFDFCKLIWDGHDYIPYVFDEWLADPRGQMFSAMYAGHAVGLTRLVKQAPGQWWLEGFRVDPRYQGLKIGSRLHHYAVAWWQEYGDGALRLWTNVERVKVQHLCEQDGFIKTMERAPYNAPPLAPTDSTHLTLLAESDFAEAIKFALRPEFAPRERGMLDACWQSALPDESPLRWLVNNSEGRIFWWRGREGLVGTWDGSEDGQRISAVGLLSCAEADIPAILTELRQHPSQNSYEIISWRAPFRPDLDALLQSAGFVRNDEDVVYQYEKTLWDNLSHVLR